ncbi:hypothetical protein MTX78_10620 [Hymenobacter tibetensis]|uniref:Uncharacterized protein n=1 Tax=Hymenobacter tibetensis TaxID=497967 RepID=A0ABY4D4X5_9BACT|nr:hypothetical protein [Hymenobacter tibetensis]UOG77034.1 hypothetical protein MTX78_10620 [Hymenobacter tibetensis]
MKQRNVEFNEVEQIIQLMNGQLAWRSRAGSGTGSIFTLQFGPALATDETRGEFDLMVYCAWRIIEGNAIICTWHNDSDSILAPALIAFEGTQVTNATLTTWGDLIIHFDTGRALQIWNDKPFENSDSWNIGYQGKGYYSIGVGEGFCYEFGS